MALPFWRSPAELVSSLPQADVSTVCYELAPSGPMHAGIVRLLHFAEQIQVAASEMEKRVRLVIRINDLAPEKSKPDSSGGGLRRVGLLEDQDHLCTRLESMHREISSLYERTRWASPLVVNVSDIYVTPTFIEGFQGALARASIVSDLLAQHKKTKVSLVYPICPKCSLVRSATNLDGDTWQCANCRETFVALAAGTHTKPTKLITFKLEQALIWQALAACIDLHGQDHIEAFTSSEQIVRALALDHSPIAARVNLVFSSSGEKLSKSRRNSKPVLELPRAKWNELIDAFDRTKYWRPMRVLD